MNYCAGICERNMTKSTEMSVMAVCITTESRIWHPSNESLKLYRSSPLSRFQNSSFVSHPTNDIVLSEINVVALSVYIGRQPVLRVR